MIIAVCKYGDESKNHSIVIYDDNQEMFNVIYKLLEHNLLIGNITNIDGDKYNFCDNHLIEVNDCEYDYESYPIIDLIELPPFDLNILKDKNNKTVEFPYNLKSHKNFLEIFTESYQKDSKYIKKKDFYSTLISLLYFYIIHKHYGGQ